MKNFKTVFAIVAAGLLLAGFSNHVQAQAITGSISFFGSAMVSGSSGAGTTSVDFSNNWDFVFGTGTYSSILNLTPATFSDFSFTGDGTGATLTTPDLPLWTLSYSGITYTFDLLALSNGHTEAGSMAFTGTGTLTATGYSDTPATFSLAGTGTNYDFTLNFETNTAIPEPNSAMLLGLGLAVGAVVALRRRRALVA